MRFLSFAFFILTATLCFITGYKVGKESPSPTATPSTAGFEDPLPGGPIDVDALITAPTAPAAAASPSSVQSPGHPLALRAKEPIQTFFDTNGRKLVAEILKIRADSLTVRRHSDGRELNVPVSMLTANDQAFVAYLRNQQESKPSTTSADDSLKSMEDQIWDKLFK